MTKIDFTEYPKILPYVSEVISKFDCKPFQCSELDNETFIEIIHDFIDEYEKHNTTLIKNTLLVYELINEETGYQCLSTDWERDKTAFGQRKRFSYELVEKWWNDTVSRCILHIYQSPQYDGKSIEGGVATVIGAISYDIRFLDSNIKGVKYNAVTDFTFSLNLVHSIHTEYDLHED